MTIFTFGDSHSVHPFNKLRYVRPNSIGPTLAFSIGRDRLARLDLRTFPVIEGDTVIFSFGEIDCRCHIHKYVSKEMMPYKTVIKNIVDSYFEGLRDIVSQIKNLTVYVYNVVPPLEVDSTVWNNPEYPFLGTNEDRKKYAVYFNECIAANCQSYSYGFFDIYTKYLNERGFLRIEDSDKNVHIMNPVHHDEFFKKSGLAIESNVYPTFNMEQLHNRCLLGLIQHDLTIQIIIDTECGNGQYSVLGCILGGISRAPFTPMIILALDVSPVHISDTTEFWSGRPGEQLIEIHNASLANTIVPQLNLQRDVDVVILHPFTLSDYAAACKLHPKYFIIYGPHESLVKDLRDLGYIYIFRDVSMAILKRSV
jgi:hypothetical protein